MDKKQIQLGFFFPICSCLLMKNLLRESLAATGPCGKVILYKVHTFSPGNCRHILQLAGAQVNSATKSWLSSFAHIHQPVFRDSVSRRVLSTYCEFGKFTYYTYYNQAIKWLNKNESEERLGNKLFQPPMMVNFMYQLDWPQGVQIKHYFWVCLWGCFQMRF